VQPSHSRKLSVLLLGLSLVGLPVSAPIGVMAQDVVRSAPVTAGELSEEERDALVTEEAVTWSEYWDDEAILESEDPEAEPPEEAPVELDPETASLPGEQQASAVTPQALSLPEAEGSIQGMGESFSPVLSSGTATYNVPIAVPAGRAGVQPTLALAYSSTGGNSCVGFGWTFEAPYISRQSDRGLPRYVDGARWTAEEDRFFYNGGQELVPVSTAEAQTLDGTVAPPEYSSWQQYRARVEGAFMRFFRAPDGRSWAVQGPDGSLLEFGEVAASTLPTGFGGTATALQTEDGGGRGRIFRWFLTRMSDVHGSTVYYRYSESLGSVGGDGSRYLTDIHYASPAACAVGGSTVGDARIRRHCTQPLAAYGRRIRFQYETRPDVFSSYVAGWRVDLSQRLTRIVVTSAEAGSTNRFMVRRYHLGYAPGATSFHSLLARVEVEGRPDTVDAYSAARVASPTAVPEATLDGTFGFVGPTLPALRFEYSAGTATSSTIDGFGGINGLAIRAPSSPPHSVDEGVADLFDVNSDGLADLLVTDPARYRTRAGAPAAGVFFNGFAGTDTRPATRRNLLRRRQRRGPHRSRRPRSICRTSTSSPWTSTATGARDLLHMPRFANYGYFLASRDADDTSSTAGFSVSPAEPGLAASAYVPVALPTGRHGPADRSRPRWRSTCARST
jgi:hypothetical protein